MQSLDFNEVFSDSFETFKVFDVLSIEQASCSAENTPKSIWQILNHLIVFQDKQLEQLQRGAVMKLDEAESWQEDPVIKDQEVLDASVQKFKSQIRLIREEINKLSAEDPSLAEKLKLIQSISTHLSFHLGEIVLIRRQLKNYPWPGEMNVFLGSGC